MSHEWHLIRDLQQETPYVWNLFLTFVRLKLPYGPEIGELDVAQMLIRLGLV